MDALNYAITPETTDKTLQEIDDALSDIDVPKQTPRIREKIRTQRARLAFERSQRILSPSTR